MFSLMFIIGPDLPENRVWSKKNDTLSKIDIFQLRKCNFMQNLMFHEAAILTDEIFWVKNHFFFNKVQNFKFKNY